MYGEFRLIEELEMDSEMYYKYFRMDRQTFTKLLDLVGPLTEKADTEMRKSIPSKRRLALTIK